MLKPLLFGYLRQAPGAQHADAGRYRAALQRFATREGFTLSQIFVDPHPAGPFAALDSLLEAAMFTHVTAVLVPDRSHLGVGPSEQEITRHRIQAAAGCPVIMIQVAGPTLQR